MIILDVATACSPLTKIAFSLSGPLNLYRSDVCMSCSFRAEFGFRDRPDAAPYGLATGGEAFPVTPSAFCWIQS